MSAIYRYTFAATVPLDELEGTLLLALWGSESLHGEATLRLQPCHCFDPDQRKCVIDAGSRHGRDVNRLFLGFASREYGAEAFRVERVDPNPGRRWPDMGNRS